MSQSISDAKVQQMADHMRRGHLADFRAEWPRLVAFGKTWEKRDSWFLRAHFSARDKAFIAACRRFGPQYKAALGQLIDGVLAPVLLSDASIAAGWPAERGQQVRAHARFLGRIESLRAEESAALWEAMSRIRAESDTAEYLTKLLAYVDERLSALASVAEAAKAVTVLQESRARFVEELSPDGPSS